MSGFSLRTLWRRRPESTLTRDYVSDVLDCPTIFDEAWRKKSREKRDDLRNRIPEEWLLREELPDKSTTRDFTAEFVSLTLDEREIEITEAGVAGILEKTTTGKWSAREVTRAFCHRAAVAHQLANCLLEIFFDAALKEADALDEYYKTHHSPKGPLHGLPISLKDQFHVKGVDTTMGYVGWLDTFEGARGDRRHLTFESYLCEELRSLGAVLYCKTSCPPTLMCPETVNNIVGYTPNPKNRYLTAGGSSGGEAALMALRGSVGGFGSDVGGSMRIPAAFNGVFGLRPSTGRLPHQGVAQPVSNQLLIPSVIGPMSTTADGIEVLMRAVLGGQPWLHDPLCVPMPWNHEVEGKTVLKTKDGSGKRLAFGVLWDDGVVRPQPPVARALHLVADILKKLGHDVIDWKPPSHAKAHQIASAVYSFDAGKDARAQLALSGEPELPILHSVLHKKGSEYTATKIAAVEREKREYQKEYLEYWNSTVEQTQTGEPVDAFIAPVAPYAAALPGEYDYVGYTIAINTLDYSAITIPVTQADKMLDVKDEEGEYVPLSDQDEDVHDNYDPEIYHGAYVGLQVVGRRYDEEKLIVIAKYLSESIRLVHPAPATNAGIAVEPKIKALEKYPL